MYFTIISIVVISVIGTLSHFLYDISKHNQFVGLFSAVNESTWEHIKIALTPTILWGLFDGYLFGQNPNYFLAKNLSLLIIIVLMPVLFYSYKKIFKKNNPFFNILIFYVVIISSQLMFNYILSLNPVRYLIIYLSCIATYIVLACYMIFTLMPLKNFLFQDPITNKYGFNGHPKVEIKID